MLHIATTEFLHTYMQATYAIRAMRQAVSTANSKSGMTWRLE